MHMWTYRTSKESAGEGDRLCPGSEKTSLRNLQDKQKALDNEKKHY